MLPDGTFVQNDGRGHLFHIGLPARLADVDVCPKMHTLVSSGVGTGGCVGVTAMQVGSGVGAVGSLRWALASPPEWETP